MLKNVVVCCEIIGLFYISLRSADWKINFRKTERGKKLIGTSKKITKK